MYRFHTYCCVPSSVNDWDSNFLKALLLFCLWKFLFCVAEGFVLTKSLSCSTSRGLSSNSSSHSSIDLDLENSISSSTPDAVTTNVVIIHSYNLFKKKKFLVKPHLLSEKYFNITNACETRDSIFDCLPHNKTIWRQSQYFLFLWSFTEYLNNFRAMKM